MTLAMISPWLSYRNYIGHIRLLDQALFQGLILHLVHKVIEFNQIAWMKLYVVFNTAMRTAAHNDCEKDFYKLMINSVFFKMMERVDCHQNIWFVAIEGQLNHLVCKPNWIRTYDFGNDFSMVELSRTLVKEFKSIYVGQAILDLSKTLPYE